MVARVLTNFFVLAREGYPINVVKLLFKPFPVVRVEHIDGESQGEMERSICL